MSVKEMDLFGNVSSSYLNRTKILEILDGINNELVSMNETLDITIYGGSSLCLMSNFRDSTYDIDTLSSNNELLRRCLINLNLSSDIVNNDIEVFLVRHEDLFLFKEYSNLRVFLPSLEYLLAMKIRACRKKDRDDIINISNELGIHDINSFREIFVKYYSPIQFNSFRINFIKECLK